MASMPQTISVKLELKGTRKFKRRARKASRELERFQSAMEELKTTLNVR